MNQRPRVLLLIPHLGGGGAEMVIAQLATRLCGEKYEVHVGLVTGAAPHPGAFPRNVTVHPLGHSRVRYSPFGLLALVRRLRPRLILSGMYHLNFLVLLLRPLFPRPVRVLVRQNGSVSAVLASGELPAYTRLLFRFFYRHADRIICQSHSMADDLAHALGVSATRLIVLHNPVDVDAIRSSVDQTHAAWPGPGPNLLAVGRLSPEKGFDLLLEALSYVRKTIPNTYLVIAGSGQEEAALQAHCQRLGLESAVYFAGRVNQPSTYFAGATAFVLSSRHEGMPNAMLEAAAAGLPIVALPSVGGVPGLLRGQPGAWLASEISAAALAACLIEALRCLRHAERFTHAFIDPFKLEPAIHAYEALFDEALSDATIQDSRR
jgi:glycosyltransferase involved in cell wall biosynthesis